MFQSHDDYLYIMHIALVTLINRYSNLCIYERNNSIIIIIIINNNNNNKYYYNIQSCLSIEVGPPTNVYCSYARLYRFWSCDLDLITLIYDLDLDILETYARAKMDRSRLLKARAPTGQTDRCDRTHYNAASTDESFRTVMWRVGYRLKRINVKSHL